MADARSMKMKEYGTDILSHSANNNHDDGPRPRVNNTVKSSVFDTTPEQTSSKARDRIF